MNGGGGKIFISAVPDSRTLLGCHGTSGRLELTILITLVRPRPLLHMKPARARRDPAEGEREKKGALA